MDVCEVGYVLRVRAGKSRYRIMMESDEGVSRNLWGCRSLTWEPLWSWRSESRRPRDKPHPPRLSTADCLHACMCVCVYVPITQKHAQSADWRIEEEEEWIIRIKRGINLNEELCHHVIWENQSLYPCFIYRLHYNLSVYHCVTETLLDLNSCCYCGGTALINFIYLTEFSYHLPELSIAQKH